MAIIKITETKESGTIRLSLNGRKVALLAEVGLEQPCPDDFLPMLRDSGVAFELVSSEAEAEEAPGGDSGDASAEVLFADEEPPHEPEETETSGLLQPVDMTEFETDEERAAREKIDADAKAEAEAREQAAAHEAAEDLKLLDLSVPKIEAAIAGFSPERLQRLIAAETAGKTRSTLIAALTARLNPPAA